MPNPSVLASYLDEVEHWKNQLRHGIHSKDTKTYIIGRLREAAAKAGVSVPAYNSDEFNTWLKGD